MSKARIELVCNPEEKQRLQSKAAKANLSLSAFLLKRGLGDDRARDTEDASALAGIYTELLRLNQQIATLPESEQLEQAIDLSQAARREIVLYRMTRRAANAD